MSSWQVPGNRDNDVSIFEEKPKENSVVIDSNPKFEAVNNVSGGLGRPSLFVSSINKDEPIVTRRELWSYYRQLSFIPS